MSRRCSRCILCLPALLRRALPPNPSFFSTAEAETRTPSVVRASAAAVGSIASLLKSRHFTDSQIADVFSRRQRYLSRTDAEPTLRCKLRVLEGWGFTPSQVREFVLLDLGSPYSKLDERELRRILHFLKNVVGDGENILAAIRGHRRLLNGKTLKVVVRNAAQLVKYGVPAARVSKLMVAYPKVMSRNPRKVGHVLRIMGSFDIGPDSPVFVEAFAGWGRVSASDYRSKKEMFESIEWSEDKVVGVVSQVPSIMLALKAKTELVTFLLNGKLNWDSARAKKMSTFLNYHFEKRIPQRHAVLKVLQAKDLLEKDNFEELVSSFFLDNDAFLKAYVWRYIKQVPELKDVYNGKIESKSKCWSFDCS